MNLFKNNLLLVVIILGIVLFALLTKCGGSSNNGEYRDTVTVFQTDTVYQTLIKVDTVFRDVEKIVRVEVPKLVKVEVPSPADTIYLDQDIRQARTYQDTVQLDSGKVFYKARTLGFLTDIELGYQVTLASLNTTVTNTETVTNTTTNTVNVNRNRLYFGFDVGILPTSVLQGNSASNLDLYPSILWTKPKMGVRVGYGILNKNFQVGYYRGIRLFQRK